MARNPLAEDAEKPDLLGVSLGAPLTDRINVEPPILNGMTSTEAKVVGATSLVFWLGIGGGVAFLTGVWQVMLAFGVFGPMVTIWMASTRLASIKRNRPDGYYTQVLRLWFAKRGLGASQFITHDGPWDIGRPLY